MSRQSLIHTTINTIYQKKKKSLSSPASKEAAHMLKATVYGNLSGSIYINELLQNADDAFDDNGSRATEVSFQILDQYLIVSHNGKPFDKKDVRGIASACSPNRDKVKNTKTIGNKGIGFKSVFSIADYVLIISENTAFRFDKNYSKWKASDIDYNHHILHKEGKPTPDGKEKGFYFYHQGETVHVLIIHDKKPHETLNLTEIAKKIKKESLLEAIQWSESSDSFIEYDEISEEQAQLASFIAIRCKHTNSDNTPWQTIPILTTSKSYPEPIQGAVKENKHKVKFIFRLKNNQNKLKQQIEKDITSLQLNAHKILFLNNVQKFNYYLNNQQIFSLVIKKRKQIKTNPPLDLISLNNKDYIKTHSIFNIPNSLQQKATSEDSLVEKYKEMKSIVINFAFPVDNNKRISIAPPPKVYCYLSTQVNLGLNFLVSSDFLLDGSRKHLQDGSLAKEWNLEIVKNIFKWQFYKLNKLASNGYWRDTLKILSVPEKKSLAQFSSEEIKTILEEFNKAKIEIPIIKPMHGKSLLKIQEAYYDKYGFIEKFGNEKLKARCIHHEIKNKEIAVKLGAKVFDLEDIIQEIKKEYIKQSLLDEETSVYFWRFISELKAKINNEPKKDYVIKPWNQRVKKLDHDTLYFYTNPKTKKISYKVIGIDGKALYQDSRILEKEWREEKKQKLLTTALGNSHTPTRQQKLDYLIKNSALVLSRQGELKTTKEIFIDNPKITYKVADFIPLLNDELAQLSVLKSPVVHELSLLVIVNQLNKIEDDEHLTNLINNLFESFKKDQLKQIDYQTLSKLKIRTSDNKLIAASECYLSNEYKPCIPLQEFTNKFNFISKKYINNNPSQAKEWRQFFIKIGAHDNLDKSNTKEIIDRLNSEEKQLINFTRHLANNLSSLNGDVLNELKNLKILVSDDGEDEFISISKGCYLADIYDPSMPLEGLITTLNFTSELYLEDKQSNEEKLSWKTFFLKLGAHDKLDKNNIKRIIDQLNHDESQLINFTRHLANNLSSLNDDVLTELKNLKILVSNDGEDEFISISEGCYLADIYDPSMPLEGLITTLNFTSSQYLEEKPSNEDKSKLKQFFLKLGVIERLGLINICQQETRNIIEEKPYKLGTEYVTYARNCYKTEHGTPLITVKQDKQRFKSQHQFSYFCNIESFDSIMSTDLFWRVLADNWEIIQANTPSEYKNDCTKVVYKIRSCFQFYVKKVIEEKYQCKPSEIYSPSLANEFGEHIKTATVARPLTDEQLELFGFKTTLTLQDGIKVLTQCTQEAYSESSKELIFKVYKHLTKLPIRQSDSEQLDPEEKPVPLLTTNCSFKPANQLVFIKNTQLQNTPSNILIRKPNKISADDFATICKIFSIKIIEDKNLQCETQESQKQNGYGYNYTQAINERLATLALIESYKEDKRPNHELIYQKISPLKEKLKTFETKLVSNLTIYYKKIRFSNLPFWLDTSSNPVLYIREGFKPLLYAKDALKSICQFLKLSMTEDDLLKLIYSNKNELGQHFPGIDFSEEAIKQASQWIDQAPELNGKEEKASSSEDEQLSESPPSSPSTLTGKRKRPHNSQEEQATQSPTSSPATQARKRSRSSSQLSPSPKAQRTEVRTHASSISSGSSSSYSSNYYQPTILSHSPKIPTYSDSDDEHSSTSPQASPSANRSEQISANTQTSRTLHLSDEQKRQIGKMGETAVFNMLFTKYKAKYGELCKKTKKGLKITRKDDSTKHLIWLNKKNESGKPYDMLVIIRNKEGRLISKRYIEIKSTLRKKDIIAHYSENEWKQYQDSSKSPTQKYISYFVFNVKHSPQIVKIGKTTKKEKKGRPVHDDLLGKGAYLTMKNPSSP